MKKVPPFVFFVLILFNGHAQSYHVTPKLDVPLYLIGASALTSARIWEHQTTPLSSLDLQNLPVINPLDEWFLPNNFSEKAHTISDIFIGTEILGAVGVLAFLPEKMDRKPLVLLALEGYMLNQGMADLIKLTVKRPRPFLYENQLLYEANEVDARLSFYSGHTSNAAFFAVLTFKSLSDMGLINKRLAISGAIVLPVSMAILRMKAGKHFFTDVLTGGIIGGAIGWILPELHEVKFILEEKDTRLSFYQNGKFGAFLQF